MAAAPSPPSLYATIGAVEIGVLIGIFLFGIFTAQVSVYYQKFPDDSKQMKNLVAFLWLLEIGHSILISCLVYTLVVTYYGRGNQLNKFTCLNTLIIFGTLITWTEQVFFSYRIYRIMNRSVLGVICAVLSTARAIACLYLSSGAFREPSFRSLTIQYGEYLTAVMVASASVDVIIAVSLCYFLMLRRDDTLKRTTRVLDRLIAWTLQTGLMTSITASVMLIAFKVWPRNYVWLGIYMFLGKLYSNSLLASLNNRASLRTTMARVSQFQGVRTSCAPGVVIPPVISIEMAPSHVLTEKSMQEYHLDDQFQEQLKHYASSDAGIGIPVAR